jgi:hypothetical protein
MGYSNWSDFVEAAVNRGTIKVEGKGANHNRDSFELGQNWDPTNDCYPHFTSFFYSNWNLRYCTKCQTPFK